MQPYGPKLVLDDSGREVRPEQPGGRPNQSTRSARNIFGPRRRRIGSDPWWQELWSKIRFQYFWPCFLGLLLLAWVVEMVYFGSRMNNVRRIVQEARQNSPEGDHQTTETTTLSETFPKKSENLFQNILFLPPAQKFDLTPVAKLFKDVESQRTSLISVSLIQSPSGFTSILKEPTPFQVVSDIIQTPGRMVPLELDEVEIKEPLGNKKTAAIASLAGRIKNKETEVYLVALKGNTYGIKVGEMVSGYRLVKDRDSLFLVKEGEILRVE